MQFRGGSQIQILFDQGLLNLKIQIQSVQNFLTNDTLRDIERYRSSEEGGMNDRCHCHEG